MVLSLRFGHATTLEAVVVRQNAGARTNTRAGRAHALEEGVDRGGSPEGEPGLSRHSRDRAQHPISRSCGGDQDLRPVTLSDGALPSEGQR